MNPRTGLRSLIDRPSGEEILPTPPASAPPRRIHATLASAEPWAAAAHHHRPGFARRFGCTHEEEQLYRVRAAERSYRAKTARPAYHRPEPGDDEAMPAVAGQPVVATTPLREHHPSTSVRWSATGRWVAGPAVEHLSKRQVLRGSGLNQALAGTADRAPRVAVDTLLQHAPPDDLFFDDGGGGGGGSWAHQLPPRDALEGCPPGTPWMQDGLQAGAWWAALGEPTSSQPVAGRVGLPLHQPYGWWRAALSRQAPPSRRSRGVRRMQQWSHAGRTSKSYWYLEMMERRVGPRHLTSPLPTTYEPGARDINIRPAPRCAVLAETSLGSITVLATAVCHACCSSNDQLRGVPCTGAVVPTDEQMVAAREQRAQPPRPRLRGYAKTSRERYDDAAAAHVEASQLDMQRTMMRSGGAHVPAFGSSAR